MAAVTSRTRGVFEAADIATKWSRSARPTNVFGDSTLRIASEPRNLPSPYPRMLNSLNACSKRRTKKPLHAASGDSPSCMRPAPVLSMPQLSPPYRARGLSCSAPQRPPGRSTLPGMPTAIASIATRCRKVSWLLSAFALPSHISLDWMLFSSIAHEHPALSPFLVPLQGIHRATHQSSSIQSCYSYFQSLPTCYSALSS